MEISLMTLGPDHIGIMLSPYKGLHLKGWNILDEKPLQGPLWNNRETYFVYYSCVKDCEPLNFSVDIEVRHFYGKIHRLKLKRYVNANRFTF